MTMSAIILGYMGFTTLPFLGSRRRVITDPREENQRDMYIENEEDQTEDDDGTIVVDKKVFMKAVQERDEDADDNEIK